MSQRTSVKQVVDVLTAGQDYDVVNQPSVQPYIDAAVITVNRLVTMAQTKGIMLGADEQEIIERWVAAHNYKMSDQAYASESEGGSSGSYQGQTGQGYEATKYGQMALRLDYSFCLNQLDKKQRARLRWLGKPVSAQIPYYQRD